MVGVLDLRSITNYSDLPANVQLLFLLFDCCPENNQLNVTKGEFAKYLKIDESTVARYLDKFCASNIIKRKFGGRIFVNPDIYYVGDDVHRDDVRAEYNQFKSDK